jgi:predicted metalloprotease with PDZ domain
MQVLDSTRIKWVKEQINVADENDTIQKDCTSRIDKLPANVQSAVVTVRRLHRINVDRISLKRSSSHDPTPATPLFYYCLGALIALSSDSVASNNHTCHYSLSTRNMHASLRERDRERERVCVQEQVYALIHSKQANVFSQLSASNDDFDFI